MTNGGKMFKRIIIAFVLMVGATVGVIAATATTAQAGCWGGNPPGSGAPCRFMFHSPNYVTPGVLGDVAVKIKCGGYPTEYWLFEAENTGNDCPGNQYVSAVKSSCVIGGCGFLFRCYDQDGVWKDFGHLNGDWQYLNPPTDDREWTCHRINSYGNPA